MNIKNINAWKFFVK